MEEVKKANKVNKTREFPVYRIIVKVDMAIKLKKRKPKKKTQKTEQKTKTLCVKEMRPAH